MSETEIRHVGDGTSLADAHAVRRAVFIEGEDVPEAKEIGKNDGAVHLVAYDVGRPIGTVRLREVITGVAKIERLAVRKSHRGQGVGRQLMREVEGLARDSGMDEAVLYAQTHVADFYADLGYTRTGDVFDESGIPHVEMRKALVRDSWTC